MPCDWADTCKCMDIWISGAELNTYLCTKNLIWITQHKCLVKPINVYGYVDNPTYPYFHTTNKQ